MNDAKSHTTRASAPLIYQSKPIFTRPSFFPALFTTVGISTITLLLIISALHRATTDGATALLVAASAGLVGTFLCLFVRRWIIDLCKHYQLLLTEKSVIFLVHDRLINRTNEERIPYDQLEFVHNFAPRHYSYLIFHLPHRRTIEVPVWSMTTEPGPILARLAENKVRIINK